MKVSRFVTADLVSFIDTGEDGLGIFLLKKKN